MNRFNINNKIITVVMAGMFLGLFPSWSNAADNWQLKITARAGNAENKLYIGQGGGATDGLDSRYDIPAFLSGDIEAYITLGPEMLWADIKGACDGGCAKNWGLSIESTLIGQMIELRWDPKEIPSEISLVLIDKATGFRVDMNNEPGVLFENTGKQDFHIKGEKR